MADRRQVAIEMQSARRDAIDYLTNTGDPVELTIDNVRKYTIKMYNLHQTLVSAVVNKK